MNRLQKTLSVNAAFSGVTGMVLILLNTWVAELFGRSEQSIFWIIGTMLIFFASTIIFEVIRQRQLWIKLIIIQDILWVVGSGFILLKRPFNLTDLGYIIIAIVAIIVLLMAINQTLALTSTKNEENR